MDPATIELIVKGVSLGADLVTHGIAAYEANKDAFTSQDAATVNAALASVVSLNDVREAAALEALDAAAKA